MQSPILQHIYSFLLQYVALWNICLMHCGNYKIKLWPFQHLSPTRQCSNSWEEATCILWESIVEFILDIHIHIDKSVSANVGPDITYIRLCLLLSCPRVTVRLKCRVCYTFIHWGLLVRICVTDFCYQLLLAMACSMSGAKPLSEPLLPYFQLGPYVRELHIWKEYIFCISTILVTNFYFITVIFLVYYELQTISLLNGAILIFNTTVGNWKFNLV